jgi:hypothetical protein
MRLYCEVAKGLRASEASITVREFDGRPQFFPLDRGLVASENGRNTVPIQILCIDRETKRAFVGLPQEADSGANRMWVSLDALVGSDRFAEHGVPV